MSNAFNIPHLLSDEPGMSQRRRLSASLDATQNLLDARDLADMLVYIHQFSKQVNFYDFSLEVSNWSVFFEKSAPFILARLAKRDTEGSIRDFQQYNSLAKNDPNPTNFQLLLDFTYRTTLLDLAALYTDTESVGGFRHLLAQEISSREMTTAIRQFIGIANTAQYTLCGSPKDFSFLTEDPIWQLDITDLFAQSTPSVSGVILGQNQEILRLQQGIERFFDHFSRVLSRLSKAAEQHLTESLYPLEVEFKERHEPHLGLLFAFLELFKHLKGQLNDMTAKHLDFYFRQVLKIQSRKAVPDAVHLVLEVQKHVQRQLLKKGIDFRDGKDANGQDILFSLDDEVVVNKAQIKSLKTLFVKNRLAKNARNLDNTPDFGENTAINPIETRNCDASADVLTPYTEGVFIAPVANSADGKGMDFKEPMTKNWATLGRDKSKFVPKIIDGNLEPQDNVLARLGFILASPILFLQEGTRTVTLELTLSETPNDFIFFSDFISKNIVEDPNNNKKKYQVEQLFKIYFSGEKEWIKVDKYELTLNNQLLTFIMTFDPTVEPIVHFNAENLKENYGTTEPVVKIEIDQTVKIRLDTEGFQPLCCAKKELSDGFIDVSAYHFLKNIKVENVKINVQVCGIKKNIIVQNDENLQDVNGLIYPFGTRPEVPDFSVVNGYQAGTRDGSNFYIGSKEIFLKHWSQVNIHLNWKDKPSNFKEYYGAYLQRNVPSSGNLNDFGAFGLLDTEFKFNTSYLYSGSWHSENVENELFTSMINPKPVTDVCKEYESTLNCEATTGFEQKLILQPCPTIKPINQQGLNAPLTKLESNTRNGFARLTLRNQDFLHKDYPFVLARQMMAFGRLPNDTITGAVYMIDNVPQVINFFQLLIDIQNLVSRAGLITQVPADVKIFIDKINEIINRNIVGSSDWEKKMTAIQTLFGGLTDETLENDIKIFFKDITDILALANTSQATAEVKFNQIQALFSTTTDETIQQNLNTFLGKIIAIIGNADTKPVKFDKIKLEFDGPDDDNLKSSLASFFTQIRNIIAANITSKSSFELKIDAINALFAGQRDDKIKSDLAAIFNQVRTIISSNPINDDPLKVKFDEIKTAFDADKAKEDDDIDDTDANKQSIREKVQALADFAKDQRTALNKVSGAGAKRALIPNEPWTPVIKNIALDYAAEADRQDIALIHLYPFDATYKNEKINENATLLPQFEDEGTLFIGFEQLEPSTNVQILFQLAEATADTEGGRAEVKWHYLAKNNEWKNLRTGFEILEDATNGLTVSGIIKLAIPEDIGDKSVDNQAITQMPTGQFWLKVSSKNNTRSVCDTLGIFTQAVRATARFTEGSDLSRLAVPIAAESVAKLAVEDAAIKQVTQPFDSFGGKIEETGNDFYLRVSERLRHKGRAATPFDYERLLLDAFPTIYKAKCIPHSLALPANQYQVDLPKAAGFVTLAVIPDLTRLKSGDLTEPRVALSVLDDITAYLKQKTTPFARLNVVNPRYEKVNIEFFLKLKKGRDDTYYKQQIETELRRFLAPWSVGDSDKLSFGQPIYYSDILTFIDQREYVDFVKCLTVKLAENTRCTPSVNDGKTAILTTENGVLRPLTPRSVLVAGNIIVNT